MQWVEAVLAKSLDAVAFAAWQGKWGETAAELESGMVRYGAAI